MKIDNSPLMDHFGYLSTKRLDIQDLIDNSRNFLFIARPIFLSGKVIKSFLMWENQLNTAVTLVMMNIFGLFISESGLFTIFALAFTSLMSFGFFHRQYKLFIKVIPSIEPDAPYNCKSHSENMRDFRLLLSVLESLVVFMSNVLLKAYSVIAWIDLKISLKFHAILGCSLLLLLFAPLRYFFLFILNLAVLLSRPTSKNVHDSTYIPSSANETPESESLPPTAPQLTATAAATTTTATATTNITATDSNNDTVNQGRSSAAATPMVPGVLNIADESEVTSDYSDQVDAFYATDSECSEKLVDDLNSDEDSALNGLTSDVAKNTQQQQTQKHPKLPQNALQISLQLQQLQQPQRPQPLKSSIMDGVTYKQLETESHEVRTSLQTSSSSSSSSSPTTSLSSSPAAKSLLTTTTTTTSTTSTIFSTGTTTAAVTNFNNRNLLNQKVPNFVDKFMELKNKAKNIPMEKCKNCGAIFTAILKRRHICNCCGNHFCSRCCSHKVPRSRFGATAPAAQTETVAVCTGCLHKLIEQRKEKVT